jgi:glycosyltransferase involved in cell wall biosynthesis
MTRCLRPRVGALWPVTTPFIPYMRANLALKQRDLAAADAIVAVSRYTAGELRRRSPRLAGSRIEVLPNGVDVSRVRAQVRHSPRPLEPPYALFVGKLARNKGVGALLDVVRRARLTMPLVVIGDGAEREALVGAAAGARIDLRIMRWLDRDEVFRWLGHAALLVFPSNWPEPLSRVLIEASALCVPIAAMNTGGTPDVIVSGETGLLSASAEELADDVRRLAEDAGLRTRLGAAAGKRAETHFDVPIVVDRFEALYRDVYSASRTRRGSGAA